MTTELCRRVLSQVAAFTTKARIPCYLVGGFLRDQLLAPGHLPSNVDLAIPARTLEVAQDLAKALKGTYICLDETQGSARIVVSSGPDRVELDLSDFRGPTLEEDLARRDFTINALALPLETWCTDPRWTDKLLDPLSGRTDLAKKVMRACFPNTFVEDPVRILRTFRFAASLGFSLDSAIPPLIAASAASLKQVTGERIRDELMVIFQTDHAHEAMTQLNALGVLDVLFPELVPGRDVAQGGYHHLDVLDHQLEAVAQCDRLMADFAELVPELHAPLAAYCQVPVVEGRSRKALIKLATLFHDVGKPATRRVAPDGEIWFLGHEQFGAELVESVTERLRLSNREAEMIYHLVLYHLRPGHLSREVQLTRRAIFRFFRDLGEDGPACLILWWADRMATRGPSSHLDQIDQQRARLEELFHAYFFQAEEVIKPPKLLDGRTLMAALSLSPGPTVGTLLRAIEEAQAEGRVHTSEEALLLARDLLQHER